MRGRGLGTGHGWGGRPPEPRPSAHAGAPPNGVHHPAPTGQGQPFAPVANHHGSVFLGESPHASCSAPPYTYAGFIPIPQQQPSNFISSSRSTTSPSPFPTSSSLLDSSMALRYQQGPLPAPHNLPPSASVPSNHISGCSHAPAAVLQAGYPNISHAPGSGSQKVPEGLVSKAWTVQLP